MSSPRPWPAVAALAFAVTVGTLQLTVVVPLLPPLQHALDVPLASATWVLTTALLAGAVAIPVLARLGDTIGRRPVLVATLGLLGAGSALAALATSLPLLLVGRALQGFSAALLPLAVGIVRQLVPAHRLGAGIGLLSATIGVGSGGGLVLAGLFDGDHRAAFWVLAASGLIGAGLVLALVRTPSLVAEPRRAVRLDVPGALLVSTALVCLLLAVSRGGSWGWFAAPTLALVVAGTAAGLAWVAQARRTADPLIPIEMLADRRTAAASLASFLLGFALFGLITAISTYAQGALGASVMRVGILLLPTAVVMLATSVAAGPLLRRFPAAGLVAAGSALVAGAGFAIAAAPAAALTSVTAPALLGLGIGLGYAAVGTMAVEHVAAADTATASGVNALVRLVGSSAAGAAGAVLLPAGGTGSIAPFAVTAALAALVAALGAAVHALRSSTRAGAA